MKHLFTLVLIIAALCFTSLAQSKTETAVIQTKIFCDHCLQCESCSGKLEHQLFFNKGIKNITLDDKAMTLTVTYKPDKITLDSIREAISKLGYDADNVKADPTAYSKLDGCCKKLEE